MNGSCHTGGAWAQAFLDNQEHALPGNPVMDLMFPHTVCHWVHTCADIYGENTISQPSLPGNTVMDLMFPHTVCHWVYTCADIYGENTFSKRALPGNTVMDLMFPHTVCHWVYTCADIYGKNTFSKHKFLGNPVMNIMFAHTVCVTEYIHVRICIGRTCSPHVRDLVVWCPSHGSCWATQSRTMCFHDSMKLDECIHTNADMCGENMFFTLKLPGDTITDLMFSCTACHWMGVYIHMRMYIWRTSSHKKNSATQSRTLFSLIVCN